MAAGAGPWRLAKGLGKLNGEPRGQGMREAKVPGGDVGFRLGQAPEPEVHVTLQVGFLEFCPGCGLVGGLRPPCSVERVARGGWTRALLSTCRAMVASACPAGLVALQMYWPESCWATRGMISVSPSSWCCHGSGERNLDQWMVGVGLPVEWSGRGWWAAPGLAGGGMARKGPGSACSFMGGTKWAPQPSLGDCQQQSPLPEHDILFRSLVSKFRPQGPLLCLPCVPAPVHTCG